MNNNYNTEYPLILLVGPSGSGKTTIAEALSEDIVTQRKAAMVLI